MATETYNERPGLQITFHPFAIGCGERGDGMDTGWRRLPASLLEIPSGGEWEVMVEGKKAPIRIADGVALVLPDNLCHRMVCRAPDGMTTQFMLAAFRLMFSQDIISAARIPLCLPVEAGARLRPLLRQAAAVFDAPDRSFTRATHLHQLAFSILDILLEHSEKDCLQEDKYRVRQISNTLKVIDANPVGSHSCFELARKAGLSPSRFNAVFKEALGVPPQVYIRDARLRYASALLLDSDQPVYMIAEACGFSSAAYFSRYFVRHTGMSPVRFRKEFR